MRFDFTDHFLTVNGYRIRYWDEGSGSPVLLIHGIAVSVESWAWNVEALAARHRVIALDIPGFGRSTRRVDPSLYEPVNASALLAAFLDALGLRRIALIGHSMGGWVALQFGLSHPARVEKLVLIDSAGFGREVDWLIRLLAVWPLGDVGFLPNRQVIEAIANRLLVERIPAVYLDRMVELYAIPGTQRALLQTVRAGIDLNGQYIACPEDAASKLTAPTLIVWGEQDNVLPVRHLHQAVRVLPDSQAFMFKRARHAPQIDCADDCNALLLAFLAGRDLTQIKRLSAVGQHMRFSDRAGV